MFPQPRVVEAVDFGLDKAVSRTEKELDFEKNGFESSEGTEPEGVCLVPHPIDLLFYMEIKQEEEEEARSQAKLQNRRRKKGKFSYNRASSNNIQTTSAPQLSRRTQTQDSASLTDFSDRKERVPASGRTISSLAPSEQNWKDVYKKALEPALQSALVPEEMAKSTSLPALPGSRGSIRDSVKVPPLPWQWGDQAKKNSLPKLHSPSNSQPVTLRKKSSHKVLQTIEKVNNNQSLDGWTVNRQLPGGSLGSIDSLNSLESVLSLCSDAPPAEMYEKAESLLGSPMLLTVLGSEEFQQACKQNGIDYPDLKKRCKIQMVNGGQELDPILIEGLAYAIQELESGISALEESRSHTKEKERAYLQTKLLEVQSSAESEHVKSSTKINKAWSAVEKANKLIEDRRAEIQKRVDARDKRCRELENKKYRERIEKDKQISEHMQIVKDRQRQKRLADEQELAELEKQVEDNKQRIEKQVENTNRQRMEKTIERSNKRNEKMEKAQKYVVSQEQERRRALEEKIAHKEETSQHAKDYHCNELSQKKWLNQTKSAQLSWHAERRRRALQNQKLERLGDIKDKHRFLQYNQHLHNALLKERNARQKEEIHTIHSQVETKQRMEMNVSPGPGEYGDFSIGKRKKLIKGGVFTRETSTSFLKNALSADALLTPGPGHYFNLQVNLPEGGSFSTAKPKTALEWEIYRASKIPGPADYLLPEKKIHGGKFSPDEISKREIDRVMAHAAQLPGPADYASEEYNGPDGKSLNEIAAKLEKSYL